MDSIAPQNYFSGFRRGTGSYFSESGGSGVLVGIVGLLLFTIAMWVTYKFLVTSLVTRVVLEGTYHAMRSPRTVGPEKMPKLNGREMTLSFWCYIEELGPTDYYKQVVMIGDSVDNARLIMVIHKSSNALYVVSRTSSTTNQKPLDDLTAYINGSDGDARTHSISVVSYIPLLRWVCVTCVYDYDIVSIYLDGDLYSVTSLDRQVPVSSVLAEPAGPLTAGSSSRGYNGYISKVTVASYAQNLWAIKALYQRGPVSGNWLTSSIGLSGYKLQWPIEKVSAED